jgi:DNA-binding MarR family transcriptional regulator
MAKAKQHKATNTGGKIDDLDQIIVDIRGCFQLLRAVSDEMCRDFALTAATRAVLEYVVVQGPATVSQIARIKLMSRQSIQELANHLETEGLVELQVNPSHRRAPLIAVSERGRAQFSELRSYERRLLKRLVAHFDTSQLRAAKFTLSTLHLALRQLVEEKKSSD